VAWRRIKNLVYRSIKGFFDDGCTQRAAAISYYVLFSIFPLMIFTVGILGLFLRDKGLQQDIVDEVMKTIPLSQDQGRNDVAEALRSVAQGEVGGAASIFGLVTLAWSSSALLGVIRSSLNVVYDVKAPRPPAIQKLLDLGGVLMFTPFFLGSIVATSALRFAKRASEDADFVGRLAEALGLAWLVASILLPILLSCVAFFLVYWLIPARRPRPIHILPGAIIAAILFEAVKVGFNVYLENFTTYDVIFGSLGAVVAFLFWVYLSANILLLGAEFVTETPAVAEGRYDVKAPSTGPRVSLGQKALKFLRSLVVRSRAEDEAGPPDPLRLTHRRRRL
jgi:membrane protein